MRRVPIIFALLLAAVTACDQKGVAPDPHNVAEPSAPVNQVEQTSTELPAIERPLGRRDLLLAVAEAASSFVATGQEGAEQEKLDGRSFTVRLRFCGEQQSNLQSSFDAEGQVLRARAEPNLRIEPASADQPGAEGFWIARPWLLSAACPAQIAAPQVGSSPVANASTIGIAEYDTGERVRSAVRNGRPYQITIRLNSQTSPSVIDLVLKGRVTRGPDEKVIRCSGDGRDRPPTCIVAVRFDEVRLEGDGGNLLAEWRQGLGA